MSLLSILAFSLIFGLMAGASVDKSHILPVALITAIILYISRDKISAREPAALSHVDAQQNTNTASGYYAWPELGQFAFAVDGESFQEAIKQLLQENAIAPDEDSAFKAHILTAHLIPDNDNPCDSNAVRIDINKRTVGYLNREQALSFRRRLDEKALANQITTCNAIITGNSEASGETLSLCVRLDIELFE
ncbi:MAG: hypothetical protein U1D41_09770 [Nitrosomonas sp.]|uniref:hypothetical protein n=1 Tax=Nitrosomonas sp. TaxID=42353 RepID=UPI002732F40D|nr:hypothetical protein [Nitrosomonas sp.]MDP3661996.1 hypothetical protein [Nitrosomonas sp.]MDZ4106425.1 hypothetical protein [Nitrosomonas sp.]